MPIRSLSKTAAENRRQTEGGKTWRDIAIELSAEIDALKEERHDLLVALHTSSQDVVRKADQVLKLDARYNELQIKYRDALKRLGSEDVDVEAEVEPEEEAQA